MASGIDHDRAAIALSPVIGTVMFAATGDILLGCAAVMGSYSGIYLSPDLDLIQITRSERLAINHHKIMGYLFYLYWLPYAYAIPHRHPLSHWPILGTCGRMLYGLVGLLIMGAVIDLFVPGVFNAIIKAIGSYYFMAWLIGLMVADTGHWVMDSEVVKIIRRLI
jgi:uncharacterized metal-binding protein